ncbi:MAG: GNAT family N-acetyltransferase [Rhodobacterales bacterium]|nr:GNAT family N-acetyltransferase [Rhodobacterales bacterium]NCT11821.1 GNAT family N-acetyltransferase [Rhodobacterales bacterium]
MTPAALAALHAQAFDATRPWSEAEFAALLTAAGTILTGDTRAFVLGRVTLDEAEVLTLATAPAYRRQGLARAALAAFEAAAQARGATTVFLEVAEDNAPARALYAAQGYAPAGRRPGYYATGTGTPVAALVLRKTLAPI